MEEAPVTAATGALGPVVAKLNALLRRRGERAYRLRRPTRKDVKLIRSKLKSIHSILWVIWEREGVDAEGKELRMEAWRLADDMNDAIDDFILTMKRSSDGKRFMEDKTQPRPFEDLKKRADDVSERCRKKWKMETAHTKVWSLFSRTKSTVDSGPAKQPRVGPYLHKDISELVQMEEPRDKLIKHLVGEEESTQQLKMACIVGPAGVGKTTLARLVYEAIEDKFQARAFVSVISCRNMTEVLTCILQQVAVDSTAVLHDGTQAATKNKYLIAMISSFLKDKRYLVIIEDVCHSGEWETIKESLPENCLGSRIVTTSRVNAMTDRWRDDLDALVHKIYYSDNFWDESSLTNKMIDMNADMLGEGFDRDHPIMKMCRGMPLAVACIFSALAKERERQEQQGLWLCIDTCDLQGKIEEQGRRYGIQNTPGFEPMVESLEIGYNQLPHHMLKTCLLYCSIYPEHHSYERYERGDLVRQWIAQGFVCKEEVAKDYFDELVSRGLIPTGVESLHPMMRSYLRCKLREDNFITFSSDIPSSPVGRLCIDYWPASSDAVAVDTLLGIDWHHIRSLVVFEHAEKVPYKHLQHLRVLDVQPNGGDLENQHLKDMCGLLRLSHLRVSGDWGGITEMPAEIARLQYLETLEVTKTKITRLPAEIGDLKQLKTLDVRLNRELAELPREMGNLQHTLETLIISGSNIREQAWEIIGTLKKLKTLNVSDNRQLSGIPRVIGELQQLKNLNVSETGITELPCQIGNLQQLQILNLSYARSIAKLPRDIGRLQHLEELFLAGTNVKKMPKEIGGLKKLKILGAQIGTLPFEAGRLPKLEGVPECVQRAWKNSDLMSSLEGEILSFETTAKNGDGGLVVGTKHMHIPQWIKEHFNNLRSLDIRICKLEEQDLKILQEMPCLKHLTLRFEAVPRKPIAISGGGFAKLRYLTVDSRVPRITFQVGAMPSLSCLTFVFQFYGGPPNIDPVGIKHLVCLRIVDFECTGWYGEDSPCISAIINFIREVREPLNTPNRIVFSLSVGGQCIIREWHSASNEDSSSEVNQVEEDPSLALHRMWHVSHHDDLYPKMHAELRPYNMSSALCHK